jgi:hypothetical protein
MGRRFHLSNATRTCGGGTRIVPPEGIAAALKKTERNPAAAGFRSDVPWHRSGLRRSGAQS